MPRPEEILTQLFKKGALPEGYVYPASLDLLAPASRSLLLRVHGTLAEALRRLNANISDGVVLPPFHVDYMDAPEPNAIAFQYEDYAFIIITVPMMELLTKTSDRLSRSTAICQVLNIDAASPRLTEMLRVTLFSIQLNFLASHELTHHIHEHVAVACGSELAIRKEIQETAPVSGLMKQAQETDADSFAVYIALTHLIDGDGRRYALEPFTKGERSETNPDEALLALFTVAAGAFFYAFPQQVIDNVTVFRHLHPPEDVRMNYVMHSMVSWCNQYRPALETWMTLSRYQAYMRAVVEAIRGTIGMPNWDAQLVFLSSAPGKEYLRELEELRLHHFGILKRSSEARHARI